ncbi:hypothetical protein PybrP1_003522 [[Pythium] brassicae (nom. inval.)]|nr:hypothetical protein PybrP1_003522 [[Pythium] brassicae (nom. inval.)]
MEDDWDDELLAEIDDLEALHLQAAAQRQNSHQQHHHDHPQLSNQQQQWACRSCTLLNPATRATCSVCSTPRGQTFDPRAVAAASTANAVPAPPPPPFACQPAKKTVQATLPFGQRPQTSGAQPVPPPPPDARWPPPQQQQPVPPPRQPQQQQQQWRPSPASSPEVRRQPAFPTHSSTVPSPAAPRASPYFPPVRQPAAPASETEADEVDDPDALNQRASWPIAYATQQRRPGEDPQARTRYLDVLDRARFPAIDLEAAHQFVYPTNYPIRAYQLAIAEKALYHNTLVSLPTGLGKTLIASVVMYNFYRWFPTGKIVFMAPTKPLVAQQIQACHEIMGIPLADTAELQGNVPPATRRMLWRDKRVFFCTPQSMQNDLRHGVCEAERFVCLVVDEAHRATGHYAYCGVVEQVARRTPFFRVLALSATPGAKFEVIQDVIRNLRIAHLESRSADDADVKAYTHARQEEVIRCTLSAQITDVKALFLRVFERVTHRLVAGNIIQHRDPEKLTRWYVLQMRERFRQSPAYQANRAAESDLALLVSLLHAKELLTVHGLSSFHEYVNGWIEERETGARLSWSKKEMLQSTEFHNLVLSLSALGMDQTAGGGGGGSKSSSHPKLLKLRDVLHEHFTRHATGSSSTRAIVFTQYRSSVTEIVALLAPLAPLLKVQAFVGQGASGKAKESKGQSQKQQQEIVRKFRDGAFNVLVATCIAEEGLDIGEVDLIVSFDALTSPVRMIQRMGRTGRKRVGRVVILVTEGDEEKKLARSVASAKTVSRAMTTFKSKFQYAQCPRMIPLGLQPELSKLEMTIPEFHASQVGGKRLRASGQRAADALGDESARRRWQLNDIEKAIGTARYFPSDWRARPRHPIVPVLVRPRQLLRAVQVTVRGTERRTSDTFLVGHSARTLALRSLVRRIHGVEEGDEEVVDVEDESESGGSQASDRLSSVVLPAPSAGGARATNGRQSLESDSQSDAPGCRQAAGDSFSFSAVDEVDRSALDASFATQGVHFSPGWNDIVSPMAAEQAPARPEVVERQQPAARSQAAHASPIRTSSASVPPSPLVAVPGPARKETSRSAPSRSVATTTVSTPVSERSSPGRRTKAALSSPPAKAIGTRERGKRGEGDRQPAAKDGASAGASEFERGEQLLERLRALVAEEAKAAAASDAMCSPEPEAVRHSQSTATGSQPTKAPHALPSFPRITRRLDFESAVERALALVPKRFGSTENCVPQAPSLDGLAVVLGPPSPELLTPEDEPVFTLLPALTTTGVGGEGRGTEGVGHEDVVMLDEPEPSASEAAVESCKPRRSLALKKTVQYAASTEVVAPAARLPVSPALVDPSPGFTLLEVAPSAVRAAPVPPRPQLPTNTQIVVDVDDLDDEVELVLAPPVASARAPGKRPAAPESTGALATQTDCCSVCLEVESYEDDPIVYCDGCELGVHQFCYGIAALPSGSWFCDSCATTHPSRASTTPAFFKPRAPSCALCPLRGGAMKPTQCGHWAHVQCFMWLPELRLATDREVLALGSLANLDPDRATLECTLCHSRKGRGVIQCAYKRCLAAFHVSCAAFAQYALVQEEQDGGGDTLFLAYCPLHGRRQSPAGAAAHATPHQQQQQTPAKPSAPNTASPSALLFSPEDPDSAKKFRKFRRLKRKYDASQRSQSPGTVRTTTTTIAATAAVSTPSSTRLSWGKRVKRSQQYSEGKRKQATAMARMFIEDDVEVHGDDDGDEDDDMDDDDDDANEHDDSFINDSSQLLYSQSSPESARKSDGKRKKRKRESLGDMRAIYARSLLESQHDMPAFTRRGQRDFSALPQHGIINACLQELRHPPSPASSAASLFSPQSVASVSAGVQQLPVSLLSPPQSFVTPEPGRRKKHRTGVLASSIPPHPLGSDKRAGSGARAAVADDDDDFELDVPEPPKFSLLPSSSTATASLRRPTSAPAESVPVLAAAPPHTLVNGSAKPAPASDDDRSLQERIEANRLKALEKLRERQRRLAQAPLPPVASAPSKSALDLQSSQVNAVPEAPSFSLFPALLHEPVTAMFRALIAARPPDAAVEIEDRLEADALLSARLAVLAASPQQLSLALGQQTDSEFLASVPRLQTCASVFKRVVLVVHTGGDTARAAALGQSPALQRLRQRLATVNVVVRASTEQLGQHLFDAARSAPTRDGLDDKFLLRLAYYRSLPLLSLGSALSLSFRFQNFAVAQMPVRKFNPMHWKRMLPWISEAQAKQIQDHVLGAAR